MRGQDVIDKAFKIVEDSLLEVLAGSTIRPIDFMLLDFQMPQKNGIQVLKEVRSFYKEQQSMNSQVILEEPVYVFLTAFMTQTFKTHLVNLGVRHIYEKPIRKD